MSTKPETVYFSHLDSAPTVSPAMAHQFLKEAFQYCGWDSSFTDLWATSCIDRINMIQGNTIAENLDYGEIWRLFESDMDTEEVFYCNPPGFAMMMSMPFLKNDLHKRLSQHCICRFNE
jgi:hypothetical protein